MTHTALPQSLSTLDKWMNTRTTSAPKPKKLRWRIAPNFFANYLFRVILFAILGSTLYLIGCNTTTNESASNEYLGVWENAHAQEFTIEISKKGDELLVHKMFNNKAIPTDPDRLGTVRNGLLKFSDGSGFYEYHKDTQTITSSGNSEFLYRRKK